MARIPDDSDSIVVNSQVTKNFLSATIFECEGPAASALPYCGICLRGPKLR